ncbi:MAG: calcium-binding protein, partial [Pseudomonadota bacterium]
MSTSETDAGASKIKQAMQSTQTVTGGSGDDTFFHTTGDGSFVLEDLNNIGTTDRLVLTDIAESAVTLGRVNLDLTIDLGQGETITVLGQLDDDQRDGVEIIEFQDGTTWNRQRIRDQMVEDLAATGVTTGTALDETYVHETGEGSYTIVDFDFFVGNDRLILTDIAESAVTLGRTGTDLLIDLGQGEVLTVQNFLDGDQRDGIEILEFQDGTTWDRQRIRDEMVDDLASTGTTTGTDLNETYVHETGEGSYTIVDFDFFVGNDRLILTDIAESAVTLGRNGLDLLLDLGQGEVLTLQSQLDDDQRRGIEVIEFQDGTTWDRQRIRDQMVEDLASTGTTTGTELNETYVHETGEGSYTIVDFDFFVGNDRLILTDILEGAVTLRRNGLDLLLDLGQGEVLTLQSQLDDDQRRGIEIIEFQDGTTWDRQRIRDQMVEDLASTGTTTGTELNETYVHDTGEGSYTIVDFDFFVGNDRLILTDIAESAVTLGRNGLDLLLDLGQGEVLTLQTQLDDDERRGIEIIEFQDGTEWDRRRIRDEMVDDLSATGTATGTELNETYVHDTGDGSYRIVDFDLFVGNDRLILTDVTQEMITLGRTGNDLEIDLGQGEVLTLGLQLTANERDGIEVLQFSDGTEWDRRRIRDEMVDDLSATGTATGTERDETYIHDTGDGSYRIVDFDLFVGNDRLILADLTQEMITLGRTGNDLVIDLGQGEILTLGLQLNENERDGIEVLEFSDGAEWDRRRMRDEMVDDLAATGTATGTERDETYVHVIGDGSYTIVDFDLFVGNDRLILTGILPADILAAREGDDAVLILPSGEVLRIQDQFISNNRQGVEAIEFSDATVWDRAELAVQVVSDPGAINDITGTSANDTLDGTGGQDRVLAFGGDDRMEGGADDDFLFGGDGTGDVAMFTGARADYALSATQASLVVEDTVGTDGRDLLNAVETLEFSDGSFRVGSADLAGADIDGTNSRNTLNGTLLAESISGLNGDDSLSGLGGDDTLLGGAGRDVISGGAGNDSIDAGGDALDVVVFSGAQSGYLVETIGGVLTVTDLDTSNGNDGVDQITGASTLRFSDGDLVLGNAPDVPDSNALTDEDTGIGFAIADLVALASDVDGDALSFAGIVAGQTQNGSAMSDGTTVTFTPDADFNGAARFRYLVSDTLGLLGEGSVFITVDPIDDDPRAADDLLSVGEGATLLADVFADNGNGADVDPDAPASFTIIEVEGDPALVGQALDLSGAAVTLAADGSIDVDPQGAFEALSVGTSQTVSLTYTLSDGGGGTDSATVTVAITGENDDPTAFADAFAMQQSETLTGNLLDDNGAGADTDPDSSDTLTVVEIDGAPRADGAITLASGSTLSIAGGGGFTYLAGGSVIDPVTGGLETFSYTVSDGQGGTSTANVSITVDLVNQPPQAVDDAATTVLDTPVTIDVLANDTDLESDPFDLLSVSTPDNGTAVIQNGEILYTPTTGFFGFDGFSYTITDSQGNSSSADVSLTVTGGVIGDLSVTTAALPDGLTDEQVQATWQVENLGNADVSGDWIDRVFLSTDNVFSGDDLFLGEFGFSATLAPGQFYARSVPVRLPDDPGSYFLFVQTDATDTIAENPFTDNNVQIAAATTVTPAFSVALDALDPLYIAGQPIPISGTATATGGGAAQFELIEITLDNSGIDQSIFAFTDAFGRFDTQFVPLEGEGGIYRASAHFPGFPEEDATPEETFSVIGMVFEDPEPVFQTLSGAVDTFLLEITNTGPEQLDSLAVSLQGAPEGWTILSTVGATLGVNGTVTLSLEVEPPTDLATTTTETFTVIVTSEEGAQATSEVDITAVVPQADLQTSVSSLSSGMLRGDITYVTFDLTNAGPVASEAIDIILPSAVDFPWLGLATPETLEPLAPGETVSITLALTPDDDLAIAEYFGTIQIDGGPVDAAMPYSFRATSDATGTIEIDILDEFSFFAEGLPKVDDATVVVTDSLSGEVIFESADVDQMLTLTDVPEGYYDIVVSKTDHETFRSTIKLDAGETEDLDAFISRQTVKYDWTVTETAVEDVYDISVESLFVTDVPAPVVVIDPPAIDVLSLDQVGEEMTVNMTITNEGLIAANNIALNFGTHPLYTVEPLIDSLSVLSAKSSITIPVKVTKTGNLSGASIDGDGKAAAAIAAGGGDVPCNFSGQLRWDYECGDTVTKSTVIIFYNVEGNCAGGDFTEPVGEARGGEGTLVPTTIGEAICVDCFPNPFRLNPFPVDCLINVGLNASQELGEGKWGGSVFGLFRCAFDDVLPAVAKTFIKRWAAIVELADTLKCVCEEGAIDSAVCNFLNDSPGLKGPGGILQCATEYAFGGSIEPAPGSGPAPGAKGPVAATEGPEVESGASADAFQIAIVLAKMIRDMDRFNESIMGDRIWLEAAGHTPTEDWLASVIDAAGPESGSLGLTDDEVAALLAAYDGVLDFEHAVRFVERIRNSVEMGEDGIFANGEEAPEESGNFASYQELMSVGFDYLETESEARDLGFADAQTFIDDGQQAIIDFINSQELGGVCAAVRISIDQEAVLTRQAFEGTLEIENISDNAITDIFVEIEVRDTLGGVVASGIFGISDPTLTNLNAVDGTGILAGGETGSALWTLLPSTEAANGGETTYVVGGTFSYTENGQTVTQSLAGQQIDVAPQPELVLDYFQSRNVFGDDPFTTEIESSVPFNLALLVRNDGAGDANDFSITSHQPRIIDNDKGLLVDFDILATEINGASLSPSLVADFGDIAAGESKTATWFLESSLQGVFTSLEVDFEQRNNLGIREFDAFGDNFSFIKQTEIHELVQIVSDQRAGADGLQDFLVNDVLDVEFLPDTLYLSDGTVETVSVGTVNVIEGDVSDGEITVQLTAAEGWGYAKFDDPSLGDSPILSVTRSDGSSLALDNIWQTDRTFPALGSPTFEDKLHLFDLLDASGTETYTITFGVVASNADPVANADAFSVDIAQVLNGNLLADNGAGSDSDPEGAGLTIMEIDGVGAFENRTLVLSSGGRVTADADGTFTYAPGDGVSDLGQGQTATDSFAYKISDGAGGSDTAVATITINGSDPTAIVGTEGVDSLTGTGARDSIAALGDDDVIDPGAGSDDVDAGAGDDTVLGGAGNDSMDGGPGSDTVSYAASNTAVTVELGSSGSGGDADGDSLTGIENLVGSAFGDVLTGDGVSNVLTGLAGNDTLNGGSGADTLDGGPGDDRFFVDDAGDVVIEALDEGRDTLTTSVDFVLPENVEIGSMSGSGDISL